MPQLKIQYRDPVQLSIHPALKQIPALGEDELKPIRAGMKYGGESIAPIPVSEEGQILSDTGRTAWLCAKARQLKEVPVCICAAADVHLIIIRDLAHRRHLSKSAIAYLAVPYLQPAMDAARMQMLDKLRKNPENAGVQPVHSQAETADELAEELGICRRMLFEARAVHKEFEDKKPYSFNIERGANDGGEQKMTLREYFEPKILQAFVGGEHNPPVGLGSILRSLKVIRSGDKSKFSCKNADQLELFVGTFGSRCIRQFKSWTGMSAEMKRQARESIEQEAAKMRPEDCEAAAATLKDIAKIYADAAKGAIRTAN